MRHTRGFELFFGAFLHYRDPRLGHTRPRLVRDWPHPSETGHTRPRSHVRDWPHPSGLATPVRDPVRTGHTRPDPETGHTRPKTAPDRGHTRPDWPHPSGLATPVRTGHTRPRSTSESDVRPVVLPITGSASPLERGIARGGYSHLGSAYAMSQLKIAQSGLAFDRKPRHSRDIAQTPASFPRHNALKGLFARTRMDFRS